MLQKNLLNKFWKHFKESVVRQLDKYSMEKKLIESVKKTQRSSINELNLFKNQFNTHLLRLR